MAAKADSLLMTVEQLRQLPPIPGAVRELHWGEIVVLTRPKMRHSKLQHRMAELLRPLLESKGVVTLEFPFRALPQYELRSADVAFVTRERWDDCDDDDNLRGSPELVVEVLSPSNSKTEMREKAALYLSTGCQAFWVVDPHKKTINVTSPDGNMQLFKTGDRIPLTVESGYLDVASVFQY